MLGGDLRETACRALSDGAPALDAMRLERAATDAADARVSSRRPSPEALEVTGPVPSNGSSTARESRCTAPTTRCACYTRNLNEVTDRLPDVVAAVRTFPPRLVLDGETIGVDDDERPDRFQDTMSRFGRMRVDERALVAKARCSARMRCDSCSVAATAAGPAEVTSPYTSAVPNRSSVSRP